MQIAKCHFTLAGNSNICGKQNRTSHYHGYNMNRVTVVSYALLHLHWPNCRIFNGDFPQNEHAVVSFLLTIATFRIAHSKIERKKLPLFYCYILLCRYVENRWFEEKWVLMHLHLAQDSKCENRKSPKTFFDTWLPILNLLGLHYTWIYSLCDCAHLGNWAGEKCRDQNCVGEILTIAAIMLNQTEYLVLTATRICL